MITSVIFETISMFTTTAMTTRSVKYSQVFVTHYM
jgi:hypothetical protein